MPKIIGNECLWAIDVDQTQLQTDMVFDEIARICQAENIIPEHVLRDARQEVEASGGSFDTMGHLSSQGVSDDEIMAINKILGANEADRDYLYDDTLELLSALDQTDTPNLSVTFGSVLTQMPKLQATKLDERPYLITDIKEKGELIKTWRTATGYEITAAAGQLLVARCGVLVDDKPKSFNGLPEDWSGYLVQRKEPKPSQLGSVPESVIKVPDLRTIVRIISTQTEHIA